VPCFDPRTRSLDHDGFRNAGERQGDCSLDGGASPDEDVRFVFTGSGRKRPYSDSVPARPDLPFVDTITAQFAAHL
jgi:hypothetical protein